MGKTDISSLGTVVALALFAVSVQGATVVSGPKPSPTYFPASVSPGPALLRVDELIDVNSGGRDVFTFDLRRQLEAGYQGLSVEQRADGTTRVFGQAYGGLQGRAGAANRDYSGIWNIDLVYDASRNVVQELFFLTAPEIRSSRMPFLGSANFGDRSVLWGYGIGDALNALLDAEIGPASPSSGGSTAWVADPFDGRSLFLPTIGPDIIFSPDVPNTGTGVPEPAEWALFAAGLLGLVFGWRKLRPAETAQS